MNNQKIINGHRIYKFTDEDIPSNLCKYVREQGLDVCRYCGAAESELYKISCCGEANWQEDGF